ncbi:MAG: hypothetical protein JSR31_05980 [Nitrospira sp.]|nr:hypothetical protein [Nitrospira sp.]
MPQLTCILIRGARGSNPGTYRVTWNTARAVRQYKFLVGTVPGGKKYVTPTQEANGAGQYTAQVSGRKGMYIQVDYRTDLGPDHTIPERLP